MILLISGLILAISIILVVFVESKSIWLIVGIIGIVLSVLVGFFVLGLGQPDKKKLSVVPAQVYCSSIAGECRIITPVYRFTTTDYKEVVQLIEQPPDSVCIRTSYNSYGNILRYELIITK